jgi:hypothetical protein
VWQPSGPGAFEAIAGADKLNDLVRITSGSLTEAGLDPRIAVPGGDIQDRDTGGVVDDSVAVDAKRILLRYGAPIAILDRVPDANRIQLAREIARTTLADREIELRRLLIERGFLKQGEVPDLKKRAKRKMKR